MVQRRTKVYVKDYEEDIVTILPQYIENVPENWIKIRMSSLRADEIEQINGDKTTLFYGTKEDNDMEIFLGVYTTDELIDYVINLFYGSSYFEIMMPEDFLPVDVDFKIRKLKAVD